MTKVVLHWDNRADDTITDIGVLKAGGQTTPKEAPGRTRGPEGARIW
jgi:hypothetical protein